MNIPPTSTIDSIPDFELGETPDTYEGRIYRLIIVKRALRHGYEDTTPEEVIPDILADLRHLCDYVGLDYAAMDKKGYSHYRDDKQTSGWDD